MKLNTKKVLKEILVKYLRATFYIAWCSAVPWLVLEVASNLKLLSPGNNTAEITAQVLGMCGILIESVSKHSTYVGFYIPKFVELIFNIFKKRGYLRDSALVGPILASVLCGAIGVAHRRGHY